MRMRQKLGNGRRHRGLRLWMGGGGRREVFGHDECRDEGRVANRTTCLGAPLQMRTKESDVRRERAWGCRVCLVSDTLTRSLGGLGHLCRRFKIADSASQERVLRGEILG